MKITIKESTKESLLFGELSTGDVFRFKHESSQLYIKGQVDKYTNLNTGSQTYFDERNVTSKVTLLDAELIIYGEL